MAATSLVDKQIEEGELLLAELDLKQLNVYAAFWMFDEDSESWTLQVASKSLSAAGLNSAYKQIQEALTRTAVEIPLHSIVLADPNDLYLNLLTVAIRVDNSRVTFSNNVVNGVRLPDMVIYRSTRPEGNPPSAATRAKKPPAPSGRYTPKNAKAPVGQPERVGATSRARRT